MEILNNLLQYEKMKIYQRTDMFNFSLDSILLANFVNFNNKSKIMLDVGTNNAIVPLLMANKFPGKIIGVEIQKEAVELAKKSIVFNKLEDKIEIFHQSFQNYVKSNKGNKVNLIVCNPPFFKVSLNKRMKENEMMRIARNEVHITLEEIISNSSKIMENKGYFTIIYRPERLIELFQLFNKYDFEPKRMQLVYPKINSSANAVLVEARFKTTPGLIILKPLISHNDDGTYHSDIKKMFQE